MIKAIRYSKVWWQIYCYFTFKKMILILKKNHLLLNMSLFFFFLSHSLWYSFVIIVCWEENINLYKIEILPFKSIWNGIILLKSYLLFEWNTLLKLMCKFGFIPDISNKNVLYHLIRQMNLFIIFIIYMESKLLEMKTIISSMNNFLYQK